MTESHRALTTTLSLPPMPSHPLGHPQLHSAPHPSIAHPWGIQQCLHCSNWTEHLRLSLGQGLTRFCLGPARDLMEMVSHLGTAGRDSWDTPSLVSAHLPAFTLQVPAEHLLCADTARCRGQFVSVTFSRQGPTWQSRWSLQNALPPPTPES